ncbi:MAG: hypothetical protein ACREP9_08620, partial [Candidatus Dormibacteraceae bacterium]
LRKSWLSALYWYFVGCCEPSDARATICYSTCLESLAASDGASAIVDLCDLVLMPKTGAFLLPRRKWTLQDCVNAMYQTARSEVVHGGRFVLDEEYDGERSVSAELSRYVLLLLRERLARYEIAFGGRDESDRNDVFLRWLTAQRRQS